MTGQGHSKSRCERSCSWISSCPEYGISRGRLLPSHCQLTNEEAPLELVDVLHQSLVLVHGGMAQNVGPVLEMVTEKYLLLESTEWAARQEALSIFEDILQSLKNKDIEKHSLS